MDYKVRSWKGINQAIVSLERRSKGKSGHEWRSESVIPHGGMAGKIQGQFEGHGFGMVWAAEGQVDQFNEWDHLSSFLR